MGRTEASKCGRDAEEEEGLEEEEERQKKGRVRGELKEPMC